MMVELQDTNLGALWHDAHEHLQTLDLGGIPGERRVIRKLPWDQNLALPYLIVSPLPEDRSDGPAGYDDVAYRFNLSFVRASNRDPVDGAAEFLLWRQVVSLAFHHQKQWVQRPVGSALWDATIEPGEILIPGAFLANRDANALVLVCNVREVRR